MHIVHHLRIAGNPKTLQAEVTVTEVKTDRSWVSCLLN
jgi:hypothetical protein